MTLKISYLFCGIMEFFRYLIIGLFIVVSTVGVLAGSLWILYSVQSELPFPAGGVSLTGGWVGLAFSLGLIVGGNIVIYKNLQDKNWEESKFYKFGCYILSFGLVVMATMGTILSADGLFKMETTQTLFWVSFGVIGLIHFIVAYKGTPKKSHE